MPVGLGVGRGVDALVWSSPVATCAQRQHRRACACTRAVLPASTRSTRAPVSPLSFETLRCPQHAGAPPGAAALAPGGVNLLVAAAKRGVHAALLSVAVSLVQCLGGRPPFQGSTAPCGARGSPSRRRHPFQPLKRNSLHKPSTKRPPLTRMKPLAPRGEGGWPAAAGSWAVARSAVSRAAAQQPKRPAGAMAGALGRPLQVQPALTAASPGGGTAQQ